MMPCYDSGQGSYVPSNSDVERILMDKLKKLGLLNSVVDQTALLCSACRTLDRMGYDFDENPSLSRWWEQHKIEDASK